MDVAVELVELVDKALQTIVSTQHLCSYHDIHDRV